MKYSVALSVFWLAVALSQFVQAQGMTWEEEVHVSSNSDGGILKVEPSAILSGNTAVVAWNDSRFGREFNVRTGVGLGWSWSPNGGSSFEFGGYLPSENNNTTPSGADSWLVELGSGEILLQLLNWSENKQEIQIYGFSPLDQPGWTLNGAISSSQIDKPAMTAIGDQGIGVAFTSGSDIQYVRSDNKGHTWSAPQIISNSGHRLRSGAGVAACGHDVRVAWLEGEGGELTEVWFAQSRDSGISFSSPTLVRTLNIPFSPPPGYAMGFGPAAFIANNAWVSCSGISQPTFHLAYNEGQEQGSMVVYHQSTNTDWQTKEIIAGSDSIWTAFPSISIIDDQIGIIYYDSRNSAESDGMDVYLSLGSSGSFEDYRVTTTSSDWSVVKGDIDHAPMQRNFGDYITLTSDGNVGLAVWTDGRSGYAQIMSRKFRIE